MLKRLIFPTYLILLLSLTILTGCSGRNAQETSVSLYERPEIKTSSEALNLLKEGNARVTSGKPLNKDLGNEHVETLATEGQKPFAVIVSCSDSRVPPEIIFDQGIGDIFVIRNAGNVIDPIALGSIEYGAYKLKSPLIVVLGHENCGAVEATIKGEKTKTNIDSIMDKINPVYEKTKNSSLTKEEVISNTETENIKYQISKIKESPTIEKLLKDQNISIVGAKYNIETGQVSFIE